VIRIVDGPAAGKQLTLWRAPLYLRVVIAPNGRVDALDQLADEPRDYERVFVYHGRGLFNWRRDRTIVCPPGPLTSGEYVWMPDVDGEQLRETAAWRAWAGSQPAEQAAP
jgi:hypothetical protein